MGPCAARGRRWGGAAALLGAALAAAGCGGPPPPPPTTVEIQLRAAPDANATPSGVGAPLAVRIYQLGSAAAFEGAEFHRLYRGDAAALGTDLVKRDEYLLAPGSTRAVTLSPPDTVRTLGIFAAYRDFQAATWRATAEVPPHKATALTVAAGPAGVTVTPGGGGQ